MQRTCGGMPPKVNAGRNPPDCRGCVLPSIPRIVAARQRCSLSDRLSGQAATASGGVG
jgi:hypothetical protein